jgi:hypothetical protein
MAGRDGPTLGVTDHATPSRAPAEASRIVVKDSRPLFLKIGDASFYDSRPLFFVPTFAVFSGQFVSG